MESLYQELFKTYKEKPALEYERQAEQVRKNIKEKDFHFEYESFIPYPSYRNKDFNHAIYKKQEFHRNKSIWEENQNYDEVVAEKCQGEFKATSYQKFLKNFMSPLTPYRSLLIMHHVGTGKCHAADDLILMYDGTFKKAKDIQVGDLLMGDDSTPRTVLTLGRGRDMMYDIQQSHAETYRVNSEHILVLKDTDNNIHEMEVQEYLKLPEDLKRNLYGYSALVEFPEKPTQQCPYEASLNYDGVIPKQYIINSSQVRFKYLYGLMKLHGVINNDTITFDIVSQDLTYLGRSLGFAVTHTETHTTFHKSNASSITVMPVKEDDYYGFTLDGNHRYLLKDFTVTHNTCTAVNIAEQYYDTFERRILVILSGNIEENFRKQIFDINKLNQCTGTKYPDMVLNKQLLSKELLEKKINDIIKQRYEFMGYKELAIYMENKKKQIAEQIKDPVDPAKLPEIQRRRQNAFAEIIRERFSNRLMIIDEAHNLRLPSEQGKKQISSAFLELMQIVENVKLILMTATPMYNTADEIVWMINLLLTNDRQDTIKRSDIFDKESNMTPEGKELFRRVIRGYVSYMRGENPYSFPFRLFPSTNNPKDPNILKKYPTFDIYGEKIDDKNKVKFLEIITSTMSKYQYTVYSSFKKKIKDSEDDDVPDDAADDENNDVQNTMQISNVVYPTENWEKNPRITYGKKGFDNCFKASTGKVPRVSYHEHVRKKYGEFLSYEHLPQYAPKIKTLIDYIKNAKGIVFIYSRYYEAGIYPLACALEHAGLTRYSVDGKHRNVMENITINDQFGGKKPKYVILSRRQELSPNNDLEIQIAKSKENMNGELIKVIIVSKIGTEGIDFKRIREVHILEPWYNLNRAEQIIGRAVRTCSHVDLPKAERNVTIYFHTNMCPNPEEESVDLRTYRISETKQKKIIEVESIMKETSIDCNLNKDVLLFTPDKLKLSFDITTAQGKTVKNYQVGDKDYSFICGFKPCTFSCNPDFPKKVTIDDTTFDTDFITDDIQLMKKYVSILYINNAKERTYEEIMKELNANYKLIEPDIVKFALEEMLRQKFNIKLPKGEGYLIYRSNKYIFQFQTLYDTMMTLEERSKLMKADKGKRLELDIGKLKPKVVAPEVKEVTKNSPSYIYEEIYKKFVLTLAEMLITDKSIEYIKSKAHKEPYETMILAHFPKAKKVPADDSELKQLKSILDKYQEAIYDTAMDRLDLQQLFDVKNDKTPGLYESMQRAKILIGDFVMNPIDKNLYKQNAAKQIVVCGPGDILHVNKQYEEVKSKIGDKPEKGKRLYNKWQKNKLVFKIRDADTTLGAVCDTSPTVEVLKGKAAKYLGMPLKEFKYQKSNLCVVLEVLSRTTNDFQRALHLSSK